MQNINLYCINNYSGIVVNGLKDSIYDISRLYEYDTEHSLTILEENTALKQSTDNLKNLGRVVNINQKIFHFADSMIKKGYVPLAFGGDHAMAIGTVSATAHNYENIGLIWIDAHSDINTESSSPSGHIHGMPISFLLGEGLADFSKLGDHKPKIKPENIVYIGLRSVDPGEIEIIKKLGIKTYYYTECESLGLKTVMEQALAQFANLEHIHFSFDFDVMDPEIFPAVSTAVPQGFNQAEVLYLFEKILTTDKVKSIDLVEYNKGRDIDGKSLAFVRELLNYIGKITSKMGANFYPQADL